MEFEAFSDDYVWQSSVSPSLSFGTTGRNYRIQRRTEYGIVLQRAISDTRRWIVFLFGLYNMLLWLWTIHLEQKSGLLKTWLAVMNRTRYFTQLRAWIIMCIKYTVDKCQSTSWPTTINNESIVGQHSIYTWLTSWLTLDQHSVDSQPRVDGLICINQKLVDSRPRVLEY